MSETIQERHHEHLGRHEAEKPPESHAEAPQRHLEAHERQHHLEKQREALDKFKLEVEEEAASGEGLKQELTADTRHSDQPRLLNKELMQKALHDSLSQIRRHLKAPAKRFSKVIHQPAVEAVSAVAASTVARPSGLLTGGLVAFIGGLGLLYVSRHYGYEYRFSAYLLLLGSGFLAGILVELLLKLLRRR